MSESGPAWLRAVEPKRLAGSEGDPRNGVADLMARECDFGDRLKCVAPDVEKEFAVIHGASLGEHDVVVQ